MQIFICFWIHVSWAQNNEVEITFNAVDTTGTIELTTLKFYISQLNIEFEDGTKKELKGAYYLLDLQESNSNIITIPDVSETHIKQIDFSIGTDSITNVSGAFDGALDPIHGMFWTWNSGYINVKMEGMLTINNQSEEFEYHIGGYAGEYKTIREVTIPWVSSTNRQEVLIDLNNFIDYIDMSKTNRVMSPGKQAALMATFFAESFYVEH